MTDKPRILCIEDDPGTAELLVEELQEAGFAVELQRAGPAGLAAAARHPDLILCDIDMPGLTGLELLRALRGGASKALRRIPFVFLTAYGQRENQIEARRLGCDEYLTKPIDFELLIEVVRNRLARAATREAPAAGARLSGREAEALTWSARGKSTTDIAVLMAISERTVNFHINNILRKLDVATRTQAAVKAALLGLIDP
jgi:DNA-binding NarL/FixJ family response regulator